MDKEPKALVRPGSTTLHISAGVSPMNGFRTEALCGFHSDDFSTVGKVKDLTDHGKDQLCANCVRRWANSEET